ncbi:hypothetical protein Slin15195_G047780 [Septoria linicola]|uniref:Uncharacterized protein n=1 Tax=Septoria linicola TaxID=215465 RepID=A0A9Q9ANJ8_9PEZI|nr:hypothetical protein Slin14017_G051320 [Septoria linicola]USW51459.1 hypothetical protein Slin15195_G047780 [Septoria linicola]
MPPSSMYTNNHYADCDGIENRSEPYFPPQLPANIRPPTTGDLENIDYDLRSENYAESVISDVEDGWLAVHEHSWAFTERRYWQEAVRCRVKDCPTPGRWYRRFVFRCKTKNCGAGTACEGCVRGGLVQ